MKSVSRRSFVTLLGTSAASAPILFNTIGSAVASDKTDPARKHIKGVKMALTDEEIAILNGKQGPTMAKVLKSVIAYGDAFEAPYLLDVSNDGHWVTGMGQKGLDALYDLADVLIEGGVKAKRPFTIDPYPMDYENIEYTEEEKKWDEGTKNGPDRSALLGHNFVYQETKPHGFYSSYFHQRISS